MTAVAQWVGLIPALPLAAALGIGVRGLLRLPAGDTAEGFTSRLAIGSMLLSMIGLLALDVLALFSDVDAQIDVGAWFRLGDLAIPLSFRLDALSLGVGTLWAFLGLLSVSFSIRYMHREPGFHRFFMALALFLGGMLLIALAGNALLAFVGWEFAGVASFLLIGYSRERNVATANAVRAFVTNRIGDAGFLMSLGFAALWVGAFDWPTLFAGTAEMETIPGGVLALGFIVAALVKSAQWPFSPWIARALEGPTPSSAIFYGSLLSHAGVYLLLRIEPLLRHVPELMVVLALIGLITAVYAALCSFVQTDVKSSLIFATLTQLGLMVLAIGLGAFTLATVHLVLHTVWRCYQFLSAPSYLLLAERPATPVPAWLARRRRLYAAALQHFWLEPTTDALLAATTRRLAHDMDMIDERLVRAAVGRPEDAQGGIAGRLLGALADRLDRFEGHLLVQIGGTGKAAQRLRDIGRRIAATETLLEQPRYLFLFVMATLVVIL